VNAMSGASSSNKKRRFIISKHPLGQNTEQTNKSCPEIQSFTQEMQSFKSVLDNLTSKVDFMDQKVSTVLDKCIEIVAIVANFENTIRSLQITPYEDEIIQEKSTKVLFSTTIGGKNIHQPPNINLTESCQILTLNSETDHPSGSWLGDPNQPEQRVRVALKQSELNNIEKMAASPEKMALSLLETLFSREVLAESNLSGKGKHKKKPLDPLLLFGIYCHLKYLFSIQEHDWARIKQNMDAKCRFFWSRRNKGLSLGGSKPEQSSASDLNNLRIYPLYQVCSGSEGDQYQVCNFKREEGDAQVLQVKGEGQMHPGAIRVVSATPEQIIQMQERQNQVAGMNGNQVPGGNNQVMEANHLVMGGHHYQVMNGQDSRLLRDAEMVECASTSSSTLLEDQSLVMVSQDGNPGEMVNQQEEGSHHETYEGDGDLGEGEIAMVTSDGDLVEGEIAMKDGDAGSVSILISEGNLMLSEVPSNHCTD